jgi:hypothetical protein
MTKEAYQEYKKNPTRKCERCRHSTRGHCYCRAGYLYVNEQNWVMARNPLTGLTRPVMKPYVNLKKRLDKIKRSNVQ